MNIKLFNFLEDYQEQIKDLLKSRINRASPAYGEMSDTALHALLDQLLDGYIDLLVTGQMDSLDKLYRATSRVVAVRGSRYSDLFELPLLLTGVIRRLLAEEYSDAGSENPIQEFNEALEQTETTSHRAACAFIDVFQEHLKKRIDAHNQYLATTQREFGVDLSSFRIEAEDPDR